MNPQDRELIVAIGRAARTCAMYRELLEVARRYQAQDEIDRLTAALARSDGELAQLISKALDDDSTTTTTTTTTTTAADDDDAAEDDAADDEDDDAGIEAEADTDPEG